MTGTSLSAGPTRPPRIFAAFLALIGLVLAFGGGWLLILGGSPYYILAALAVLASAYFLWKGERRGVWIYLGMLGATLLWTLFEVRFNWWGWAPRLVGPAVLGAWMATPWVWKSLH